MKKIDFKSKKVLKSTALVIQKGMTKFSQNIYIRSLMEGFISSMPIIIVASVIGLLINVPIGAGAKISVSVQRHFLFFNQLTMGIVGLFVTGNIARCLTDKLNTRLKPGNMVNGYAVFTAAICSYLFLSISTTYVSSEDVEIKSLPLAFLGTKGMLPGILIGFFVPNVYYLTNKYNITIRLPKVVPGSIAQAFKDIIPFAVSTLLMCGIGLIFLVFVGQPFVGAFNKLLEPYLTNEKVSNSYGFAVGQAFIYSMFWFMGIHPGAIEGMLIPILSENLEKNLELVKNGFQASNWFTYSLWYTSTAQGGTGSTLLVPIILLLVARSQHLKVAGKTSVIPVLFAVNEPILFGTPMILNPLMFIPFILTPIINVLFAKTFVTHFGMNGGIAVLPWSLPSFIQAPIATGFDWKVFILMLIQWSTAILLYTPFLLIQDRMYLKNELQKAKESSVNLDIRNGFTIIIDKLFKKNQNLKHNIIVPVIQENGNNSLSHETKKIDKEVKILVICFGAGTSMLLANQINKGAARYNNEFILADAISSQGGEWHNILDQYDIIILSPQVSGLEKTLKANPHNSTKIIISLSGKDYIDYCNDSDKAYQFINSL